MPPLPGDREPLISVVLPVYNGSPFLAAAIGSLLAQTHRRLELVIVDDGSTDDSAAVVEAATAGDDRAVFLRRPHEGVQRTRNAGVAQSRGDYVAHMDQDNIASPHRLSAQLAWLREHQLDVCGTMTRTFGDTVRTRWVPSEHRDVRVEFLFSTALIHATTLMRADVAHDNPFDESAAYGGYELLTRLSQRYRTGNVPQVLLKYRLHGGQRTRLEAPAIRADLRRFRARHFEALYPESTAADHAAVERVAESEAFISDDEFERAAGWVERFADTPDDVLRTRMLARRAAMQRPAP